MTSLRWLAKATTLPGRENLAPASQPERLPKRPSGRVTRLILSFSLQRLQQRVDHSLVVTERSMDTRSVLSYVRIATVEHLDREGTDS